MENNLTIFKEAFKNYVIVLNDYMKNNDISNYCGANLNTLATWYLNVLNEDLNAAVILSEITKQDSPLFNNGLLLLRAWESLNSDEVESINVVDGYPFDKSFDELLASVSRHV